MEALNHRAGLASPLPTNQTKALSPRSFVSSSNPEIATEHPQASRISNQDDDQTTTTRPIDFLSAASVNCGIYLAHSEGASSLQTGTGNHSFLVLIAQGDITQSQNGPA